MKTWQEIKESPNYPRLRKSLEFRCARTNLLIYAGCTLFSLLLLWAAAATTQDPTAMSLAVMMVLLFLGPFAGFYIYRMFRIFSHIDDYTFTEVVLDKPHGGFNRMMYFSVSLRDRSGAIRELETHELFHTHGMTEPLLEDYVNQKVLVGYNNTTEFVAVIGKLN